MSIVLTLNLPDDAASFLSRRAAAEHRPLAEVVEAILLREQALEAEANRPVTLVAVPELAGVRPELLRDEDETEAEFAARQRGFNALLGLP
jgi:hypothetical protein